MEPENVVVQLLTDIRDDLRAMRATISEMKAELAAPNERVTKVRARARPTELDEAQRLLAESHAELARLAVDEGLPFP